MVILTANAGAEDKLLYVREGFDGYLVKPVSGEMLEQELYRQLQRDLVIVTDDEHAILEESMAWMQKHKQKAGVVITAESVADIPKELVAKHNIALIPHRVETEDGIFEDGYEIDSNGLIAYMNKGNSAWTKAPDVEEHETFFAEQLENANNVIHLSISGKLNNSGCEIATEAAGVFDNVTVFDTGQLSSGQGIMVLEACRMAEEGMEVSEIIERLKKLKGRIHSSFIVENMDYLARAGQVNEHIADIASAFTVHPVLELKDGSLKINGVYYGSRDHAWRKYIDKAIRKMNYVDHKALFITYVGLSQKELDIIRDMIGDRIKFDNIYFQKASPAIAVNSGPVTFGFSYMDE